MSHRFSLQSVSFFCNFFNSPFSSSPAFYGSPQKLNHLSSSFFIHFLSTIAKIFDKLSLNRCKCLMIRAKIHVVIHFVLNSDLITYFFVKSQHSQSRYILVHIFSLAKVLNQLFSDGSMWWFPLCHINFMLLPLSESLRTNFFSSCIWIKVPINFVDSQGLNQSWVHLETLFSDFRLNWWQLKVFSSFHLRVTWPWILQTISMQSLPKFP